MDKIEKNTVKYLIPKRPENSNKGTFGRILTIAGSLNYQGAAYLSAVSALKSGAGLVSLATIETVINNISALTPNLTFLSSVILINSALQAILFRKSSLFSTNTT